MCVCVRARAQVQRHKGVGKGVREACGSMWVGACAAGGEQAGGSGGNGFVHVPKCSGLGARAGAYAGRGTTWGHRWDHNINVGVVRLKT